MAENKHPNVVVAPRTPNFIYPILTLWGVVFGVILTYFAYNSGDASSGNRYYLLPWCFATGAVFASPSVYLLYKGKFDPFHPLVFPAWSYFFPAFFIGGIVLASGAHEPYYLAFVEDQRYNLPLTLVYIMLGYAGLVAGFALPLGKNIGERISRKLQVWDWRSEDIPGPGMILLGLGLANTILAFTQGILGFQRVTEIGVYDGLIFLFSLFWLEATFLLWLYVFRSQEMGIKQYLIVGILLFTSLTKSAFQGNRGSLISIFILIAFAFVFSGRKIRLKHNLIGAALVVIAIFVGMIYGTTFRNVKQNQDTIAMDEYAGLILETLSKISEQDVSATLGNGFDALAERIDGVTPLSVVVANYEKLAPYEESYGLDNNIWNESVNFFIPRIIWPDKPVTTDPTKYADLYFNFTENSFTLTPMGDLLRNFGPYGVPLGMIFVGFIIRIAYATLMENQEFSFWRSTMFYMLLTSISYEGSFGQLVPYLLKVGFISLIGILVVRLFAGKGSRAF